MNILMTADTVGGVWTYALELIGGLAPHGIHVHLATMGAAVSPAQLAAARQMKNLTLHTSAYKLEWMQDPWRDVDAAGEWLLELARKTQPDLVHLNGYAHAALPFGMPTLCVAHSCVLSWWRAVKGCAAPTEEWAEYRQRVTAGLRTADMVVAPTKSMLAATREHYGPFRAARAIYNGRAAAGFRPAPKLSFIFGAGRVWDEAKNLRTLQTIAPELPWPVYIAGEEAQPGGDSAPLSTRRLGQLTPRQVASWLGLAGIYCLPARYEPFGLSVLEAALSGCALVLGDIPSLREVWGDTAVYVPPEDAGALRAALDRLIATPTERSYFAARARARARRYNVEAMIDGYLDAYSALTGQRPAAPRIAGSIVPSRTAPGAAAALQ